MSVARCPSWPLGEIIALDVVGSAVKRCVVEDVFFILGLDTWLAPLTPRCQLMGRRPVESLTGPGRRPTSAIDDKAKAVAGTTQPPMMASNGARRWRVTAQKLFDTRRQGHGVLAAGTGLAELAFVPIMAATWTTEVTKPPSACPRTTPGRQRDAAPDQGIGGGVALPSGVRMLLAA